MNRTARSRIATLGATLAIIGSALTLGSCSISSNDARSEALSGCQDVDLAARLYQKAQTETQPQRNVDLTDSDGDLQLAMPQLALAVAHSQDPRYQGLMTDLSETNRVSESLVLPAAQRQCATIESNQQYP